jgi:hypothetical protein
MSNPLWLDGEDIFGLTVEKVEIPRPGKKPYYSMPVQNGIGVLHTTEGNDVKSALDAMDGSKKPPDPCHFIAGENRIIQTRPIGVQAASLHAPANTYAYIQIEMVGKTDDPPRKQNAQWLPVDASLKPAIALIAYCSKNYGIPLIVPNNWPDTIDDVKPYPSTNNSRRIFAVKHGLWPNARGWWMHMEVPFQAPSWHWDCGAIQRRVILKQAQDLLNASP